MTRSTSRTNKLDPTIPLRFHARLMWIDAESRMGWLSVDETWKKLWDLQVDITPYLKETNDGETRK